MLRRINARTSCSSLLQSLYTFARTLSTEIGHATESTSLALGDAVSTLESTTAKPYVTYLMNLGFANDERDAIIQRYPGLEKVSFSQSISAKLEFLSEKGMSREGTVRFIANVLVVYPEFLDLDLLTDIRPVFRYLRSLGLSDEEVLVMMIRYPHLMGFEVEEVFIKKIGFLVEMGFEHEVIAQMLRSFPQFFGVSLNGNIQPVVLYLSQEMDLSRKELVKVFSKCPQLFGVRLSAIRAKLDFLIQTGFELKVIRALTKRFPSFLRTNLKEDLRPTIELLLEYTAMDHVCNLFYICPQCLCLSYDQEILPKFRFFAQMGYDPIDLNILLQKFPEVLCYSLEDEIMPAVQKSIDVGISLLQTRILFAREPDLFRQTIAKVTRDIDKKKNIA